MNDVVLYIDKFQMENYDDYVGVHLNNVHSTDSYTHTVIFDVVLVSDETKEMYKWMLRLFLDCMENKYPKVQVEIAVIASIIFVLIVCKFVCIIHYLIYHVFVFCPLYEFICILVVIHLE